MHRWALLRCISQKSVVYAKKDSQPFGWLPFLRHIGGGGGLVY